MEGLKFQFMSLSYGTSFSSCFNVVLLDRMVQGRAHLWMDFVGYLVIDPNHYDLKT